MSAALESLRHTAQASSPGLLFATEEMESSTESLRTIIVEQDPSALTNSLYSYWIDYANGYTRDSALLLHATVATVELATQHTSTAWSTDEWETLNRAMWAIYLCSDIARSHVGEKVFSCMGAAFIDAVLHLAEVTEDINHPSVCWIDLCNSIVPIWPDARSLFAAHRLSRDNWRAWLGYISMILYRSVDNPLPMRGFLPWRRFAGEFGLRWQTQDVAVLLTRVTTDAVCHDLATLFDWTTGEERDIVAAIESDVRTGLTDDDFRDRKSIMAAQLASATPSDFWPDEYGIRSHSSNEHS